MATGSKGVLKVLGESFMLQHDVNGSEIGKCAATALTATTANEQKTIPSLALEK